jgi:hypothetical protein
MQFTTSSNRHSPQYGDPQSNRIDWNEPNDGETIVGLAAAFGYPCGYNPNARETGEEMYPRKYLAAASLNAMVMRLPPISGRD